MSPHYLSKDAWHWCEVCRAPYIECPKCGNNCCNGGTGKINGKDCDFCDDAYVYQDKNFLKTAPKKYIIGTWYFYKIPRKYKKFVPSFIEKLLFKWIGHVEHDIFGEPTGQNIK